MNQIHIDRDKCRRDGICVAECPFNLIVEGDAEGFPEMRPAAARLCIDCGHCVAVCPHGALSLKEQTPGMLQGMDKTIMPPPDAVEHLLKTRRSIRTYRAKPVPRETLARLLDTGRWAPSAKNEHPVHWQMIESPAEVQKLAGLTVDWLRGANAYPGIAAAWDRGEDMVLRHAPHLVIAHAATGSLKPEIDCTLALGYLDIAAHSLGIGTCWAGIFMAAAVEHPPLIEELDLPENHKVYGAMMLGHAKFKYFRIPQRHAAKVIWR